MITFKIKVPHDMNESQFKGMFLSFITAVEDVALKRRKATYIQHFFRERLDRREKRTLRSSLGQIINQLQEKKSKILNKETANLSGTKIPKEFLSILETFQSVKEK